MPVFQLGVNYWPRRSAMYMWQRFDLGEIGEDMARIKALGLHVVRFFLMWDAFQPAPDRMDEEMLRRFDAVMQAIADAGLQAIPTLYCGHMSGVNWLPSWSLDPNTPHGRFRTIAGGETSPYGIGDFYSDPLLLDAQAFFAKRVAERVREHPALLLWDLGNEFSNLREPKQAFGCSGVERAADRCVAARVGAWCNRRHARRRRRARSPLTSVIARIAVGNCDDARLFRVRNVLARTLGFRCRTVLRAARSKRSRGNRCSSASSAIRRVRRERSRLTIVNRCPANRNRRTKTCRRMRRRTRA